MTAARTAALLAALAVCPALAACGGAAERKPDAGPVRATVQRYFGAVGAQDGAAACAELTAASRERLAEFAQPLTRRAGECPDVMRVVFRSPAMMRLATLRRPQLTSVALRGAAASVRVRGVGAPLRLLQAGGRWSIDFTPSVEADKLPGGKPDADAG